MAGLIIFLILIFGWAITYPLTDLWVRFLDPATVKRGITTGSKICLTFDDGPNPKVTPEILAVLADYKIPAVFFLAGFRAEKYPELVRRIQAAGHEIGLHTYYHRHAYLMFLRKSMATIRRGKQVLEGITGKTLFWFRPPWGALNLFQYLYLKWLRLKVVLWTANAVDWDVRTGPAKVLELLQKRVKPGAVIVVHDAGGNAGAPENTLKALPEVINYFQSNGYQFVSLAEITGGHYERHNINAKAGNGN